MLLTDEQITRLKWLARRQTFTVTDAGDAAAIAAALYDLDTLHRDNDRLRAEVKRLEAERDATERRALRARAWEYDPGGKD